MGACRWSRGSWGRTGTRDSSPPPLPGTSPYMDWLSPFIVQFMNLDQQRSSHNLIWILHPSELENFTKSADSKRSGPPTAGLLTGGG